MNETQPARPLADIMAERKIANLRAAGSAADKPAERPAVDTADVARNHLNVIRAGAVNLLIVRADQLGRSYVTPTDMQRLDIVVGAIMREPAKTDAMDVGETSRIAPQTAALDVAPEVLDALERELAREG